MSTTEATDYTLDDFTSEVGTLVTSGLNEHPLTEQVATRLRKLLAGGLDLPPELVAPRADKYVMRPLYVAPDGSFSVAAAVWGVGQGTPVHGHETWGVVGIHSGIELETRYSKPEGDGKPLVAAGQESWGPGEVTVCCTTDDDVHTVSCGGDTPCVGIHVYGADIGTLQRRSYNPATGDVSWFVSRWG
ncbi:hypothetical protein [Rhodococcus koreensis]|uniref:cysteine dioxygenase family protein n=1 Tax=Rhodococcus koreensis TaxID=99653 RepID=UPI0036734717